jgi:Ca2+-binding EF-hand superfamily protein
MMLRASRLKSLCAHPRQAMIDEFDIDSDGKISLEEFINIMVDDS